MEPSFTLEIFLHELQNVLQNLYDPTELRKSRLVAAFGLENRPNPALALQDLVTNAIQALRPRMDVPVQSNAWRLYNVLTYRYVEQSSQAFVADNMGLSVRQLRREERQSERLLAEYLWKKHNLQSWDAFTPGVPNQTAIELAQPGLSTPDREQELEWLRESFPNELVQIQEIIDSALKAVSPLTQPAGRSITCQIPENLPPVIGQVTAMRQALLNLLLSALHTTNSAEVAIRIENTFRGLLVSISAAGEAASPSRVEDNDFTEMARKFSDLFDGEMTVTPWQPGSLGFFATLVLPVTRQIPVLVIDDNADTLRLLQRYLSGTPYHFIGLREPEQALPAIVEYAPSIIIMDVMMPGMDDWELLGRLRAHPIAHEIPVIVCTILPQKQLALALGAAGFLRKPVKRQEFLEELERQSGHASRIRP